MSIISIVFSTEFIIATASYAIIIMLALPCFDRIHRVLEHSLLQWSWDKIGMPFLRAVLMLLFLLLSYPVIFAISDAPPVIALLDNDELRVNYLINLIFVVTLLFPLIPVLGKWEELILPAQAITASAMLFSWLAADLGFKNIHYWPGIITVISILVIAFLSHWLALAVSHFLGDAIDEKFSVEHAGHLLSRALVLFMQSPAILLYGSALGRQLN
ncbi:MAG: hypothetical protein HN764_11230 [Gammaproteobacteria bacterium]|jgi:hypothetical protein|nr:hypothetical protein [Gammaproteobacteria bacterium]